jgi:AbrB family looped-hinge helix DNA binding protein
MQVMPSSSQTEWVKILDNGLITIPKAMRKQAGIKDGDVARATLVGNKIIIEPRATVEEYRVFTSEQVVQWMQDDALSPEEVEKLGDLFDDIP